MSHSITDIFYKQRNDFFKEQKEREKRLIFPDDVSEIKDISYLDDGDKAHRLDIYRPKKSGDKKLPVIINVHGGGLILGSKEFNRYFCANLCKLGYVVFSVEYRLVPECMFYDQCEDLSRAFDFIDKNIPKYGGDKERIFAAGDSGGACLLTYTAAMIKCRPLAMAAKVKAASIDIKALGLISGMFYTNRFDKLGLFLPKYLYGRDYKKSSYAKYVNPENTELINALPPCFLVTSKKDNLKHYTINFTKALKRNNKYHKLICFEKKPELTHAFSVFEPNLKESIETIRKMSNFFRHCEEK